MIWLTSEWSTTYSTGEGVENMKRFSITVLGTPIVGIAIDSDDATGSVKDNLKGMADSVRKAIHATAQKVVEKTDAEEPEATYVD
jgi:hypothetical protein